MQLPHPAPAPGALRAHERQRGEGGEGREGEKEGGGREQEEQGDGEPPKPGLSCSTSQVVSSPSRWEVTLFKPPPPSYSLLLGEAVVVALVCKAPGCLHLVPHPHCLHCSRSLGLWPPRRKAPELGQSVGTARHPLFF